MNRYLNALQAARFLADGLGAALKMPNLDDAEYPNAEIPRNATALQLLIKYAANGEIEPTGCDNGGPREPIPHHFWIDASIDLLGENGESAHRKSNLEPSRHSYDEWTGLRFDVRELEQAIERRTERPEKGKPGKTRGVWFTNLAAYVREQENEEPGRIMRWSQTNRLRKIRADLKGLADVPPSRQGLQRAVDEALNLIPPQKPG